MRCRRERLKERGGSRVQEEDMFRMVRWSELAGSDGKLEALLQARLTSACQRHAARIDKKEVDLGLE